MRQITSDIYMLEQIGPAPAFLLPSDEGLTLIDTGLPHKANTLIAQLEESNYPVANLRTIVLTHAHTDHTGGAAELVKRSGAKMLAHQDEIPYILQQANLPIQSTFRRLMFAFFNTIFRTRIERVDVALRDGDMVDALGGLTVIHLPGHTPGSIALYQKERRLLFTGDVFFNDRGRLRTAPDFFNVNTAQEQEAARKLAEYEVDIACFGHGEPILEHAGDRMREVVR